MKFILSVFAFLIAVVISLAIWSVFYSFIPRGEYENVYRVGMYLIVFPFGGFALIVGQALSTLFVGIYERIFNK